MPENEEIFVADTVFTFGELGCLTKGLREVFRTADCSASPSELERARLQAGLIIVADFVMAAGIGDDVAKYFAGLAGYLSDLDKGITHPVLARTKMAGAPADSYAVWMARVTAILGFECFVSAGDGVEQAARFLSKRYPLLKKLCRQRGFAGVSRFLAQGEFSGRNRRQKRARGIHGGIQNAFARARGPHERE